jgi:hypothetical protein
MVPLEESSNWRGSRGMLLMFCVLIYLCIHVKKIFQAQPFRCTFLCVCVCVILPLQMFLKSKF